MTITTIPVTLDVPKESKEIVDFMADIIVDIKAKKSVTEIATENFMPLFDAVKGFEDLDDEAKSQYRDDLAGYLVQRFMEVLMPVKTGE